MFRRVAGAVAAVLALTAGSGLFPAGPADAAAVTHPPSCPRSQPGHVTCFAVFAAAPAQPSSAGSLPAGYGPAQLASAYEIPATDTTATVAIVEAFDNPQLAADLAVYRSTFGLPPCGTDCLHVVDEHGGAALPTGQRRSWYAESDLAVQMVSAVCPSCHITVVEADSSAIADMYTAVQTAADLAPYVAMSWGDAERGSSPAYTRTYFAERNVAFVAASGDYGYNVPDYPAASPNVLAVGGTMLQPAADPSTNPRGWDETVWNDGDGRASASGCSQYSGQPAWQADAVSSTCAHRSTVDVSVVANTNERGVAVYTDPEPGTDTGPQWTLAEGTSVGAPIVAAMYALAGTPNRYNHPSAYPYYHAADLNDITSGDNLFLENSCDPAAQCTAQPGYDGPSGLGSPRGVAAFAPVPSYPVHMTPPDDVTGFVGDAARVTVSASTDDPLARIGYQATGLPGGVELGPDGVIAGTPTTAGTYTVAVTAVSSAGPRAKDSFTWTVERHTVVAVKPPAITGTPALGTTLRVRTFGWRQDTTSGAFIRPTVTYHWLTNGHRIRHATQPRFTVPDRQAWLGRHLTVQVTARLKNYSTYVHVTAPTRAIRRSA